jgi:hypothetical protein
MKKLLACALLSLSVPLAGCAGFLGGLDSTPVLQNTIVDEKALIVAEAAFDAGSTVLEAAVDDGHLKGAAAAQASAYYTKAKAALDVARAAQKAGDSKTLLEASIEVQSLVTKIFSSLN